MIIIVINFIIKLQLLVS